MAFTRKIFQGTLPTVKFRLFSSPMRNSLVHWLTLPKICGRNAARVSPFISAASWLATINPSGNAISAPATPSRAAARDTTSFGVAYLATNWVPGEGPRFVSDSSTLAMSEASSQT